MRARRYARVTFGIVILIVIGYVSSQILKRQGGVPTPMPGASSSPAPSGEPSPGASTDANSLAPTGETSALPSASPSPSPSAAWTFAPLQTPSAEDLRREVESDPHGTPASLIDFAKDLSARMEVAKQDEKNALAFYPNLEECTRGAGEKKAAVQVQTLCLGAAEELAGLYPKTLETRFQSLSKEAPPKALQLRRAFKSLNR